MAYPMSNRQKLADPLPVRGIGLRYGLDALAFLVAVGFSTAFVIGIF